MLSNRDMKQYTLNKNTIYIMDNLNWFTKLTMQLVWHTNQAMSDLFQA
jgi:hypothetical protein